MQKQPGNRSDENQRNQANKEGLAGAKNDVDDGVDHGHEGREDDDVDGDFDYDFDNDDPGEHDDDDGAGRTCQRTNVQDQPGDRLDENLRKKHRNEVLAGAENDVDDGGDSDGQDNREGDDPGGQDNREDDGDGFDYKDLDLNVFDYADPGEHKTDDPGKHDADDGDAGSPRRPYPPWFRGEEEDFFIRESFWNSLPGKVQRTFDLTVIFSTGIEAQENSCDFLNVRRHEFFTAAAQKQDGAIQFGKGWLNQVTLEQIKGVYEKRITKLCELEECKGLLQDDVNRKIFWSETSKKSVRGRLRLFNNMLFTPHVRSDSSAQPVMLWAHFKANNGQSRVAIVRGCSGTGKTMTLVHHEIPHVLVFYLHLPELLHAEPESIQIFQQAARTADSQLSEEARKTVKNQRDEAATRLVVNAVSSLLNGKRVSSGADERVLIAVDEGGANRQFARAYCAMHDVIAKRLLVKCFTESHPPREIHFAIAGTGVEASNFDPASEVTKYVVLEPCPAVWQGCCAKSGRVASVLSADPKASPLQVWAHSLVENARAAAVLASVTMTSKVWIRPDSDQHLIRLCGLATEELRELNGLRCVTQEELAAVFVHAAFLQGSSRLSEDDFNVVRRFGVLVDTTPLKLNDCGSGGASKVDRLRRYKMPEVFSAWLHFMVRFGLRSTAGDDFEETVAEYVSLALIAPQSQSYFSSKYWDELYLRRPRSQDTCWCHPFELFDFIATIPGRQLQKGCTLIRLANRFAAKSDNGLKPGTPSKADARRSPDGKASKADARRSPDGKASKADARRSPHGKASKGDAGRSPDGTASKVDTERAAAVAAGATRLSGDGQFGDLLDVHLQALASELTVELSLDPHRHTIVINGPQAPFADLMIFPHGTIPDVSRPQEEVDGAKAHVSRHVILVQCKGSDIMGSSAPTNFTAFDVFTELYKMGSGDTLSNVAHFLDELPPPKQDTYKAANATTPPAKREQAQHDPPILEAMLSTLDGVDACILALLVRLGRRKAAFAVAMEIMHESNLTASVLNSPEADDTFLMKLRKLHDERVYLDAQLLNILDDRETMRIDLQAMPAPPSTVKKMQDKEQLAQWLAKANNERAALVNYLIDKRAAMKHSGGQSPREVTPPKVSCAFAQALIDESKLLFANDSRVALLSCFKLKAHFSPDRTLSRLNWPPNPNKRLLEALGIAHECQYKVARVVIVWKRPVDIVSKWCLPQHEHCLLVHTTPWKDKVWPPTNLYPLVEHSTHVRSGLLHPDWQHSLSEILYRPFPKGDAGAP